MMDRALCILELGENYEQSTRRNHIQYIPHSCGAGAYGRFFCPGILCREIPRQTDHSGEMATPLPDIEPKNPQKQEDFTFYKTLSDKQERTVSIELKPKPAPEKPVERKAIELKPDKVQPKQVEVKTEKDKTETAKPATPKPAAQVKKPESPNSKLRYTLQISSYQEKQMAEQDVKQMKQRGYSAFVVASELEGKGTWYRVRVGSFSNKEAAEKLQKELRAKAGVTPFITIE